MVNTAKSLCFVNSSMHSEQTFRLFCSDYGEIIAGSGDCWNDSWDGAGISRKSW